MEKQHIIEVYQLLKNRQIHPTGHFDKAGRWWAEHTDLIDVRSPSRAWPYSEMQACRTLKYVKRVCEKFGCENAEVLKRFV